MAKSGLFNRNFGQFLTSNTLYPMSHANISFNQKFLSNNFQNKIKNPFLIQNKRHLPRQQYTLTSATTTNGSKGSSEYDYDLITIGGGSGGVRAARQAASRGAKVALCELPFGYISSEESGGLGGTCVLRGCVPKKLMVYASSFAEEFKDSIGFGWCMEGQPRHTWETLLKNKRKELDRLNSVYRKMIDSSGVDYIEGRGLVINGNTVEINGKKYTAENLVIATGGTATKLKIPGAEYAITSDDALELEKRPNKIVIIGGGYIAVEFAGIFNGFGSEVHLVYRADRPLRGFDEEIRTFLSEEISERGLNLHPHQVPVSIEKQASNDLYTVNLKDATKNEISSIKDAEVVFMATGRSPNTKNIGLEALDVELVKNGAIKVDEYSRTNVESIWAIGDVTDRINLTPVALMEAMALMKTIFDKNPTKPDHTNVPSAVFSQPPLATVGLTEEVATEKYDAIDVYTSAFRPLRNTVSGNTGRAMMKILVDADSDKVIGIHMVGDDSAEIMQGMAIAVKMGVTKSQIDSVVGIHPTAAEEFVTMRSITRQIRKKKPVTAGS